MKLDSRPLEIGRDLPTVDRAVVNRHTATLDRRVRCPKGTRECTTIDANSTRHLWGSRAAQ